MHRIAALAPGFALSNLQAPPPMEDPQTIDVTIYMLNVVAVHACTCSCLMSALLYSLVNRILDDKVVLLI